jgi:hypothetical protein
MHKHTHRHGLQRRNRHHAARGAQQRQRDCPQFGLLLGGQLGLFAAQSALGSRDRHPFPSSHSQQVDFEFGEGGEDVETSCPSGRWGRRPVRQGELDAALGKGVADIAGVGHRSCEAVELRYDEGVAL